ncbi:Crp/Fnr family transcriptional regulator [Lacibacter sp.]|uniref:Crp/Fnr family transcriptional regulator n=1 Tax=Lacibacter sp. TaxID=1915409 RepID=UPI002B4B81D8|nr:Crp/Fnr family transcriptional regulator [Lacibacter sp.]HLP36509.1 Crp/Fnr family transcriptional regulator [Lacibacter sp.]
MSHQLLLDNFKNFINLTQDEEELVLEHITERRFKRGDFLNSEGEVNRFTNFITKGSARVYYIEPNGHEHIVQLGISKWWIGDFPSFITQTKASMFTEALETTEVLSFSHDQLQLVYEAVPKMERFFRLLIQNAYGAFHRRVLQSLSLDAEQRYVAFRNAYPEMDLQISQKHIASYLGMSPEFLSTIKRRIVEKERERKRQKT